MRICPHPLLYILSLSQLIYVAAQSVCIALSAAVARFPFLSCTESSRSMWAERKMLSLQHPTTVCTSSLKSLLSMWVLAVTSEVISPSVCGRIKCILAIWDESWVSQETKCCGTCFIHCWSVLAAVLCDSLSPLFSTLALLLQHLLLPWFQWFQRGWIIVTSCASLSLSQRVFHSHQSVESVY